MPKAKMRRIQTHLESLAGGKRGLQTLRVLPDLEQTFELTWKDVVGYMSVHAFCTNNLEGHVWSLECRDAQPLKAVHIQHPRLHFTILKFGI
jgi:hypothetical protein